MYMPEYEIQFYCEILEYTVYAEMKKIWKYLQVQWLMWMQLVFGDRGGIK